MKTQKHRFTVRAIKDLLTVYAYASEESASGIAEALGCSSATISSWLAGNGMRHTTAKTMGPKLLSLLRTEVVIELPAWCEDPARRIILFVLAWSYRSVMAKGWKEPTAFANRISLAEVVRAAAEFAGDMEEGGDDSAG